MLQNVNPAAMALSCLFSQAENLEVFEDVDQNSVDEIPMEEIESKDN